MSASQAYDEALHEMDDVAEVGLKAAVEALRQGDDKTAVILLHGVADTLDDA